MYHLQNPVNGLVPFRVLVAQLVEHPPSVWKVMGSNPIGDSDLFFRVYVCFNYSFKTYKTTILEIIPLHSALRNQFGWRIEM